MRFIPKTFKYRIIIGVMLLHAFLIGILIADMAFMQIESRKNYAKENADMLAASIAVNSPSWIISSDVNALSELALSVKNASNVGNIYIMDRFGVIKASSDTEALFKIMDDEISNTLKRNLESNPNASAFVEHDSLADTLHPIKVNNDIVGFVRITMDNSMTDTEIRKIYINSIFYMFIAIVLGGILAYLAIKSMLGQMEQLSNAAEQIMQGEENVVFNTSTDDNEVNKLSLAFQNVIFSLKEQINHGLAQQELLQEQAYELEQLNKHLGELVQEETSKRLKQETLLLQQEKMAMMGEMIGAIAHQWRQPLNSLGLDIQDLLMAYKFGEINDKYMETFKINSMTTIQKMSHTIDDFRDFFKPTAEMQEFAVEDAIKTILTVMDAQLKNNYININFMQDKPHIIHGYKSELEQVMLILISNAKDAVIEKQIAKPFIAIEILEENECVVIQVRDNGQGVPPDIIDRIFEPYFTTKTEGKGTGIGLYIAKEIIQRHMHGNISVFNDEQGAVFKIELNKNGAQI